MPGIFPAIAVVTNISLMLMLVASSVFSTRTERGGGPIVLTIIIGIGLLFLVAEMLFRIDKVSDIDE